MWHATIEKFVDGQWVHCMNLRTSSPGIQQLYRWIASKNGCDLRITVDSTKDYSAAVLLYGEELERFLLDNW
jgi:hypothetical protein